MTPGIGSPVYRAPRDREDRESFRTGIPIPTDPPADLPPRQVGTPNALPSSVTADAKDWTYCLWSCLAAAAAHVVEERREEERAAALSKLRAHVRTGTYRGTITRTIRNLQREVPRAETLCGGEATSKDHNAIGARQVLRDAAEPWLSDMCPACRAKLEGAGVRDLSRLPGRRGSSTAKQRDFLRRLLDEGARNGSPFLMDARGIDQMSSREASAKIDELKALKVKGWKS